MNVTFFSILAKFQKELSVGIASRIQNDSSDRRRSLQRRQLSDAYLICNRGTDSDTIERIGAASFSSSYALCLPKLHGEIFENLFNKRGCVQTLNNIAVVTFVIISVRDILYFYCRRVKQVFWNKSIEKNLWVVTNWRRNLQNYILAMQVNFSFFLLLFYTSVHVIISDHLCRNWKNFSRATVFKTICYNIVWRIFYRVCIKS